MAIHEYQCGDTMGFHKPDTGLLSQLIRFRFSFVYHDVSKTTDLWNIIPFIFERCRCRLAMVYYSGVIMSTMVSRIIGVSIVCSTVCSNANQRKHQSSASLAFVTSGFPSHNICIYRYAYPDQPATRLNLTGTTPVNLEVGPGSGDYKFFHIRYAQWWWRWRLWWCLRQHRQQLVSQGVTYVTGVTYILVHCMY